MRGARRSRLGRATWCALALVCLSAPTLAQEVAGPRLAPDSSTTSPTERRLPSQESMPLGMATKGVTAVADSPPSQPSSSGHMIQTVLTLAVVIGVIVLVGVGVKKLARAKGGLLAELGAGGRAPAGVLEVLGRYPVSRGSMLVLLKLDRRILLLCQTQGRRGSGPGMSTLCEITDPEEVAAILLKTREEEGDSLAKRFQTMLKQEDSWPAVDDGSTASTHARPRLVADEDNTLDQEPLEVVVRSRADRPLAAASSGLRSRVDSMGASRQSLAKGGRA